MHIESTQTMHIKSMANGHRLALGTLKYSGKLRVRIILCLWHTEISIAAPIVLGVNEGVTVHK
jgi:hypothetical protein